MLFLYSLYLQQYWRLTVPMINKLLCIYPFYRYLDRMRADGITLMNIFVTASLWDNSQTWGHLIATDQYPQQSPKVLGLLDYIANYSVCSAGQIVTVAQQSKFSCINDCNGKHLCLLCFG